MSCTNLLYAQTCKSSLVQDAALAAEDVDVDEVVDEADDTNVDDVDDMDAGSFETASAMPIIQSTASAIMYDSLMVLGGSVTDNISILHEKERKL